MKLLKRPLWMAIAFGILSGCTIGPETKDGTTYHTNQSETGVPLTINVARGPAWVHKVDFGYIKATIIPQMAFWIEDTNGTFLQNIFVTRCFAKQKWRFIKTHQDSCYRTMCMPYWLNKMVAQGLKAPTQREPLPDAVSGATPTGSFTIKTRLPEGIQKAVFCCEINKSFDNNETWKKGKAEETFNGQPAIVYRSAFDPATLSGQTLTIPFYGRSGESFANPNTVPDSSGLTTALEMVQSISITMEK